MLFLKPLLYLEALIFGLIVGSFLNVCIYRIPKKLSLWGRSFCPVCTSPIPFYRNIPLVSYLLQGGKSHCCHKPISPQYPLVEALTGLVSLVTLANIHAEQNLPFIRYFLWFGLFMCPLLVLSFIDLKLKIIPDVISIPFIFVGTLVRLFEEYPHWLQALKISGLGILVGSGSLLIIAEVVSRLKKTDAMGGGDIKLAAGLGAFLGWQSMIFIFFVSSVIALVFALTKRLFAPPKAEDRQIPFGPFLSLASMIFWLYGKPLTDFYFLGLGFGRNPFFP